jgi:hypothetical protein
MIFASLLTRPTRELSSIIRRAKSPNPRMKGRSPFLSDTFDGSLSSTSVCTSLQLEPGPSPLSRDGPSIPPEEKGITRMEVVGGYIFQQIAPSQCYFRTIADIDLKLALVPAWVINFISRQLAGLGLKLFEKVRTEVGRT